MESITLGILTYFILSVQGFLKLHKFNINTFITTQGKKVVIFLVTQIIQDNTMSRKSHDAQLVQLYDATTRCHLCHQMFPMCAANTLFPCKALKVHCHLHRYTLLVLTSLSALNVLLLSHSFYHGFQVLFNYCSKWQHTKESQEDPNSTAKTTGSGEGRKLQ